MRHLLCWLIGWAVMGMTVADYASKLETAIAAPTNTTLWWTAAHAATNTTRQRLSISPKTWLFGSANDRLKKKRVALLMAGNVRTHDSCAPSIRKHLLEHKYNDRWRFEIVALAYKERFGHEPPPRLVTPGMSKLTHHCQCSGQPWYTQMLGSAISKPP